MKKEVITTENAPAPVGPYSMAVKYKELVFLSGQIAIDPATEKMIEGGVKEQTKQIFANIEAILKAANSSLNKILKITVFLRSMDFFAGVNDIFNDFLEGEHPARETVEVCRLPKDADIEISVIAHI